MDQKVIKILKKLFCKNAIRAAVVVFVVIAIMSGFCVEILINEQYSKNLYSFGQSYPLMAKGISYFSRIIPICFFLTYFYMQLAAFFMLFTSFYDEKKGYFEKIKLLLYFKTTWIIALILAFAQFALFLKVKDGLNGLWAVWFLITSPVIGICTTNLILVTLIGSLFFIIEIKKYWKEIKSFYFIPCLYPIAAIIYYIAPMYYYLKILPVLSGKIKPLQYSLLPPILIIGIIIGILWLDYKRSAHLIKA